MSENNNFREALNAGLRSGEVKTIDGHPFVVVPNDARVQSLCDLLLKPLRIKASPAFEDEASFVEYVKDRGLTGALAIFASIGPSGGNVEAVLDYHTAEPDWCSHTAKLGVSPSSEWATWCGFAGSWKPQLEMAEFLQDNSLDVVVPDGIVLLELVQTLRANTTSNFKSQTLLDNGQVSLAYEETVNSRAGQTGELKLPELFTIGVPIFANGSKYKVDCRLRFRISQEKKLTLRFDICNKAKLVQAAKNELIERLSLELEHKILLGSR